MYNLKASLYMYVTVCLPSFVAKTYDERKIWPDFAFRSSINIHHVPPPPPKEKKKKSVFESEQKYCVSLENYFSKKLLDMTLVSMSMPNFVNMR